MYKREADRWIDEGVVGWGGGGAKLMEVVMWRVFFLCGVSYNTTLLFDDSFVDVLLLELILISYVWFVSQDGSFFFPTQNNKQ